MVSCQECWAIFCLDLISWLYFKDGVLTFVADNCKCTEYYIPLNEGHAIKLLDCCVLYYWNHQTTNSQSISSITHFNRSKKQSICISLRWKFSLEENRFLILKWLSWDILFSQISLITNIAEQAAWGPLTACHEFLSITVPSKRSHLLWILCQPWIFLLFMQIHCSINTTSLYNPPNMAIRMKSKK